MAGVTTYGLSAKTFRDRVIDTGQRGGVSLGDTSFADYAMANYGGWWTNKRMPAADATSKVQQAILYRKGRSMMGGSGGMRTAVCPHWNMISIDDIYSGSAQGERYFTMHVPVGRCDPGPARRLRAGRVQDGGVMCRSVLPRSSSAFRVAPL